MTLVFVILLYEQIELLELLFPTIGRTKCSGLTYLIFYVHIYAVHISQHDFMCCLFVLWFSNLFPTIMESEIWKGSNRNQRLKTI